MHFSALKVSFVYRKFTYANALSETVTIDTQPTLSRQCSNHLVGLIFTVPSAKAILLNFSYLFMQLLWISRTQIQPASASHCKHFIFHLCCYHVPAHRIHPCSGILTSLWNKFALYNANSRVRLRFLHNIRWIEVSV